MKDVQQQADDRRIPINKVGIKNLRYPISLLDRANSLQHTVGSLQMTVNLPHAFRGTHMSRFVEILNENHQELHIDRIGQVLSQMKTRLSAEEAHIELTFPYFIEKQAPVSGARSLMEYTCFFGGTLDAADNEDFVLGVEVPVTTLCPCSKALSEAGAHNQRSLIRLRVRYRGFIWLEELIETAESCASSPLYAILKREDEKFVTEAAYDNPKFVEDVVRELALKLNQETRISWYCLESENMESIHNHNAYAAIYKQKES